MDCGARCLLHRSSRRLLLAGRYLTARDMGHFPTDLGIANSRSRQTYRRRKAMGEKVRENVGRSQGSEIAGRDSQAEVRNFRFGMRRVCVDGSCRKLPAHIMVVLRTCRLRLPGWFTCPNRNWPIQASVASRASASVADCSQCLSRKYEAAQHPDPPPHSSSVLISFLSSACHYTTGHTTADITTALQHVGTIYCTQ